MIRIFCDHSGELQFRPAREGERRRGLVICAVMIPEHLEPGVRGILPRDETRAAFLKASDAQVTDDAVARFTAALLDLDVDVCWLGLDLEDPSSHVNATDAARFANFNRAAQGKPKLSVTDSTYWLYYTKAIIAAWGARWGRTGAKPTSFAVAFDSEQLAVDLGAAIEESIVEAFRDEKVRVDGASWHAESDEPLLYAPDLIAGAVLRQYRYGDCPATHTILSTARASGRVVIPDVIEILSLPTTEELDKMGA